MAGVCMTLIGHMLVCPLIFGNPAKVECKTGLSQMGLVEFIIKDGKRIASFTGGKEE
jgi:hypothetical protein